MITQICDVCGCQVSEITKPSEDFKRHLPKQIQDFCGDCMGALNKVLDRKRSEYIKRAWAETALTAVEMAKKAGASWTK